MYRAIKAVLSITACNYRTWHKNIRIILAFLLAFIMCFFLTDKAMNFSYNHGTTLQLLEPFIWTFGDSNSILLASSLLLLLFADMPFITPATPFYLVRINRLKWVTAQILYIISATFIYMVVVLSASVMLCMNNSYSGNIWSKTAAILGYSGEGQLIAIPAFVKTLEMSNPASCAVTIFILILLYTLTMVLLMMLFNILKGHFAGVLSAFIYMIFGFIMNPENLILIFKLPDELAYKARVWVGWMSPLNHATYHMHDFGYDMLPTLRQTYILFGVLIIILAALCTFFIRRYNFDFRGTEV